MKTFINQAALVLLCAGTLFASTATAQTPPEEAPPEAQPTTPPAGPADIINGAREARDVAEAEAAQRAAAAPTEREQAALNRARGANEPLASSRVSTDVPAGTIRVIVTDGAGNRVAGAPVRIGVMVQAGSREEHTGVSDAAGQFVQADLPTGSAQAYRVTVEHDGASYGTQPFRLDPSRGQIAQIRRVDTTTSQDAVLITIGQMMLEYKSGRIHVTEQMRLTNLSDTTVVFENGVDIALPIDFTAFQSQAVMSDQQVTPTDPGFKLEGSLPPGTITLTWAYDVPLSDTFAAIQRTLPFKTYRYRVITDASEGMSLSVVGFPEPEAHESEGRRVLLTSVERSPEDERLETVVVRIDGIPQPGPMRFVAVGGMFMLMFFGMMLLLNTERRDDSLKRARTQRRDELLAEAEELQHNFDQAEVGPKYLTRRMDEILDELASLERLAEAGKDTGTNKLQIDMSGLIIGAVGLMALGTGYSAFLSVQYFDQPMPWWMTGVTLGLVGLGFQLFRRADFVHINDDAAKPAKPTKSSKR
ncbi:MAG: hypothetical protein ACI9KE_004914 [Polyangiales bacterium]|jgi:hypothetical protein